MQWKILPAIVAQHIRSFQEFPPRQKPGSFSVNEAMHMLIKQKREQLV
jgi:arylsulfatase